MLLSKILIRMASGLKLAGIVKLRVGVNPLPEMVTLVGNGTGLSAPASVGVVANAESGPLRKVRSHAPSLEGLKEAAEAQKRGSTASGAHVTGPTPGARQKRVEYAPRAASA